MNIETQAFGTIEVDESQIVTLTEPMPGFADLRRFALLDPDPEHPLKWFQSVDRPETCFLIADPACFFPDYAVRWKGSEIADLKIGDGTPTAVAVVLTVPEDPARTTANLLAPLVFNTEKKLARQVVLEGSGHPVRAPLFQEEKLVSNSG